MEAKWYAVPSTGYFRKVVKSTKKVKCEKTMIFKTFQFTTFQKTLIGAFCQKDNLFDKYSSNIGQGLQSSKPYNFKSKISGQRPDAEDRFFIWRFGQRGT